MVFSALPIPFLVLSVWLNCLHLDFPISFRIFIEKSIFRQQIASWFCQQQQNNCKLKCEIDEWQTNDSFFSLLVVAVAVVVVAVKRLYVPRLCCFLILPQLLCNEHVCRTIIQHCVQHSIYFRNVVTKFLFFFSFLVFFLSLCVSACLACFILKCYCIVCWPLFYLFFLFLQCIDCIILRMAIGKLDTFLDDIF